MTELSSLLIPIVVATVAVFILSFVFWVLIARWHQPDVQFCPEQEGLLKALKDLGIKPGNYMFPNCADLKDWKSDEFKALCEAGPWGTLNLWPSKSNMGKNLALTFVAFLITTLFVGYITSLAHAPGAGFLEVFRVSATAAMAVYVLGGLSNAIWFGKPMRFIITDSVDGVIYALVTGAVFGFLWPALSTGAPANPMG